MVLALLGLKAAAPGGEDDPIGPVVAAHRGEVTPALGLRPDERVALVLDGTRALPPDDAASVLNLSADEYRNLLEAARDRLAATQERRAVILEDDWFGRRRLEDACQKHGIALAASTADPALAVGAAMAFRPGIALIDLAINGDELAGEIAAMAISERCPGTRVVLVTGYDCADRIAALMPNSEALVKPFTSNALERVLKGQSAA